MSRQFNKIGVIGKHGDPNRGGTLSELLAYLRKHESDVLLDERSLKSAIDNDQGSSFVDRKTMGENCDLVIVVGGDGTLLNAARDLVDYDVPLVGINLGRLGFLAGVTPSELEETLDQICSGIYKEDQRTLLQASVVRDGKQISENTAFNDVVLHTRNVARMIEYETYINDQFVHVTRSDGLIVSTPTGSTAYALSGGGPIVHPELEALVLVPICPHTMSHRPIVVDADNKIEIVVSESNQAHAQCTCDGQVDLELENGDRIVIVKKKKSIRLIHPASYDYFKLLRAKLHWGKRL